MSCVTNKKNCDSKIVSVKDNSGLKLFSDTLSKAFSYLQKQHNIPSMLSLCILHLAKSPELLHRDVFNRDVPINAN